MKKFFLGLILLLLLFSTNGFAEQDENLTLQLKQLQSQKQHLQSIIDNKLQYLNDSIPILTNMVDSSRNKINGLNNEIDDNKINIKKNQRAIDASKKKNSIIDKYTKKNSASLAKITESSRINEKILAEHIFSTEGYQSQLNKINIKLNNMRQTNGLTHAYLDRFWVMISAALVFLMQAGFKTFESGMVRKEHDDNVAIKNIIDWLVLSLIFFVFGFGFMYGDSFYGLIGTSLFAPTADSMQNVKDSVEGQYLGLEFFLYQLAFAATAATIVSGAMSERIALIPYIFLSCFIGIFIYPLFGHWAWGGKYLLNEQGWLYALGFRDFAGSTVVHSIGAWVALAGIIVIGPRIGRYDKQGNVNEIDFVPNNLGYSTLGVLIIWFGWWGFSGGSELKYDEQVSIIILNTNISGSAAGITAFFHALTHSRDKYEIFPKLLGGMLGGLVAIAACCNSVSSWEAVFIGAAAGLIHNFSHDFLMYRLKLDDPVGAVAVHGACGVWGTLCVGFFGQLDADFFAHDRGLLANISIRMDQILVQIVGILSAFFIAFPTAYLFFNLIRKIPGIGLRVLPSDEKSGSILGISN